MKIIHCADLHLDSSLSGNLPEDMRRDRREELFESLVRLVDYANKEDIRHIIIAGDLFDRAEVRNDIKKRVYELFRSNGKITFYYLRGNHDGTIASDSEALDNLREFAEDWTYYSLDGCEVGGSTDSFTAKKRVRIAGIELGYMSASEASKRLSLDEKDVNILVLHGQVAEYDGGGDIIPLSSFRNRFIDYMALGHLHTYSMGDLDARGRYCYSGCLEGRGFDECGRCSAVLLDVDETSGQIDTSRIELAKRRIFTCEVDLSRLEWDIELAITTELEKLGVRSQDMVKIILKGEVADELEINTSYIERAYGEVYYYVKAVDQTSRKRDDELTSGIEASLRGEFIRLVEAEESLDTASRKRIIRIGLSALSGENLWD